MAKKKNKDGFFKETIMDSIFGDNQKEEIDREYLKSLPDEEKTRSMSMKLYGDFCGNVLIHDAHDNPDMQVSCILNLVLQFCSMGSLMYGFQPKKMLKHFIDCLQKIYDTYDDLLIREK
jgi:hypothetical protein